MNVRTAGGVELVSLLFRFISLCLVDLDTQSNIKEDSDSIPVWDSLIKRRESNFAILTYEGDELVSLLTASELARERRGKGGKGRERNGLLRFHFAPAADSL